MITQGYLTGKLLPKLGEMKMLLLGFLLTGISYAINSSLPYFPLNSVIYIGTIIYSIGSGFFEPSIGALTSRAAGPEEQGLIQGASQSMQAITRIIGPFAAALLYKVGINVPFISNVVYSAIGFVLLFSLKDVIRKRLVSKEHSHKF
jgi:DHA1 family tetracycline resistance protein-like MFS transporter